MGTAKDERPQGDEGSLSLQELAEQTGIEQRTIRSYVERGILPGPESLGRGARYPRETLDRLRVMQLLRDANRSLTLDQVRVLLQSLSPAQLHDIASGAIRIAGVIDTDAPQAAPGRGDALAYLKSLRAPDAGGPSEDAARFWHGLPPHAASLSLSQRAGDAMGVPPVLSTDEAALRADEERAESQQLSALAQAARVLASLAGTGAVTRNVRGESWYRIPITPDIELSVRGAYGTEEMAQLHRIGDALRQLLTKGAAR